MGIARSTYYDKPKGSADDTALVEARHAIKESFMKTLKVEGVYPVAFESAEDVAEHLPRFIDSYNERRLHSALGYLSPNRFEEEQSRKPVKTAA